MTPDQGVAVLFVLGIIVAMIFFGVRGILQELKDLREIVEKSEKENES